MPSRDGNTPQSKSGEGGITVLQVGQGPKGKEVAEKRDCKWDF